MLTNRSTGPTSGNGPEAVKTDIRFGCWLSPCASIHLPLATFPVRLAQLALQDLAGGIARQCLGEVDGARHLVAGDALPRVVDELLYRHGGAGFFHHDRLHRLAPLRVGHADDSHVGD